MAIDFDDERNKGTYATREADRGWVEFVRQHVDLGGARVADVGCGGGIYSLAMLDAGAGHVVGIDGSAAMVAGAKTHAGERDRLEFEVGDAAATGRLDAEFDLVLQRALIHHVPDLDAVFAEARRILRPGGVLIVQDRTMEDVRRPGGPEHLRGYFFERFPRLLDVEALRRPTADRVGGALAGAGFDPGEPHTFDEPRRTYASPAELDADIVSRAGRSILHELDDDELADLAAYIVERLPQGGAIREEDRWTLWVARAV
ncbi:class I SAM-dependent methyltransferase [Zhihengliuella halotolerans]|uniref:class I SAM-dependent methyltransferase n=1 Tax=Zhihengliuella halotolerans TaxID=370736 RepID=UPI000C80B7FC|nr:class I SAM-dependent methyltransferase [Zhihengliuella halotolerans]